MNDTITIVGVIGTDPDKTTPNGVPITRFRVASKERRFDRASGTWVDGDTNWYNVSTYRRLAEHCFASLHKRDRVILIGRIRVRNWEAGEKRGTSVDIDAEAIGPELQFGTTAFTANAPASDGSSPAAAPTEDSWALTGAPAQAWANPGHDMNPGARDSAPSGPETEAGGTDDGSRQPELAGAETPF